MRCKGGFQAPDPAKNHSLPWRIMQNGYELLGSITVYKKQQGGVFNDVSVFDSG